MDIYHIWCDLKEGVGDTEFSDQAATYLGHLKENGSIAGFRITRRKLGLGPANLPEFHLMVEVKDLNQLEHAFRIVGKRSGEVETFHQAVNSLVRNAMFALYRDFPDPWRDRGGEKF